MHVIDNKGQVSGMGVGEVTTSEVSHRRGQVPFGGARLLNAQEVAELLGCSWRTVLRLADAGKIPWGVKLGSLRRWDQQELEQFIEGGCKPLRRQRA
jgi:excisionase family DNA binding protein